MRSGSPRHDAKSAPARSCRGRRRSRHRRPRGRVVSPRWRPSGGPHGVLLRIDPKDNRLSGTGHRGSRADRRRRRIRLRLGHHSGRQQRLADRRTIASRVPAPGAGPPIGVAIRSGTTYVANSGASIYGFGGQVTAIAAGGSTASHSILTNGVFGIANGSDGLWIARPQGAARLRIVSNVYGRIDEQVALPPDFWYSGLAVGAGSVWVLDGAPHRTLWRIDPSPPAGQRENSASVLACGNRSRRRRRLGDRAARGRGDTDRSVQQPRSGDGEGGPRATGRRGRGSAQSGLQTRSTAP